jgi:transcription elongation factor Elf1
MPVDQYEDEDNKEGGTSGANSRFKEFDCPSCNANNPVDPAFGDGDEILCNYCGEQFKVKVNEEGRMKLKEM